MTDAEQNAKRYIGKYIQSTTTHKPIKTKSYELPRIALNIYAHGKAPRHSGAI
jgi:hypothetical protein